MTNSLFLFKTLTAGPSTSATGCFKLEFRENRNTSTLCHQPIKISHQPTISIAYELRTNIAPFYGLGNLFQKGTSFIPPYPHAVTIADPDKVDLFHLSNV